MRCKARRVPCGEPHKRGATQQRARSCRENGIFIPKQVRKSFLTRSSAPLSRKRERGRGEGDRETFCGLYKHPHPLPPLRAPRIGLQANPASAAQSMLCETPLALRLREKGSKLNAAAVLCFDAATPAPKLQIRPRRPCPVPRWWQCRPGIRCRPAACRRA